MRRMHAHLRGCTRTLCGALVGRVHSMERPDTTHAQFCPRCRFSLGRLISEKVRLAMIRVEDVQKRAAEVSAVFKAGKTQEAFELQRKLYADTLDAIQALGWLGIGIAPDLARAALETVKDAPT